MAYLKVYVICFISFFQECVIQAKQNSTYGTGGSLTNHIVCKEFNIHLMRTLNLKQFANGLNFSGSTKSIVYTSGQKKKKRELYTVYLI